MNLRQFADKNVTLDNADDGLGNGPRLTLCNGGVQAYLIGPDWHLRSRLLSAVTRLVLSLSTGSHAKELQSNRLKKNFLAKKEMSLYLGSIQ